MDKKFTSGVHRGQPPLKIGHSALQDVFDLLSTRHYKQVEQLLQEQQEAAQQNGQMAMVVILAAACQLCLTCRQYRADSKLHQLSLEEAVRRERESRLQIQAVLTMLSQLTTVETQVEVNTTPDLASIRSERAPVEGSGSDKQPSLIQKVKLLLGFEQTPPSDKSRVTADRMVEEVEEPPVQVPILEAKVEDIADELPEQNPPQASIHSTQGSEVSLSDEKPQPGTEQPDIQVFKQARPEASPGMAHVQPAVVGVQEESSSPMLAVYCLGPFQVYANNKPIERWPSSKGKSIFKYLATNRERPTAKEVLMDVFWPDADPDAARNNLNVAIYGLRQVFRNGDSDISYVLYHNEHYLLNPELHIWLDVEEFMALFLHGRQLQHDGRVEEAVREYHTAAALYQGEFLEEDRYDEWLMPLRQQLIRDYLELLERLSQYYSDGKEYASCITICRSMLAIDPCLESTHYCLMCCFYRQGQQHLALRQYHQCVKVLKEDLEVVPGPQLEELYEKIRLHEAI